MSEAVAGCPFREPYRRPGPGFPATGGLGASTRAGGPGQTLIRPLYKKVNSLAETRLRAPRGICGLQRLSLAAGCGWCDLGAAETRPKPL
jgi:hypothetical protein